MLQSVFYYLLMFDSLKNSGPALILLMIIPSPRFHFYIFTNFYESRVLLLQEFQSIWWSLEARQGYYFIHSISGKYIATVYIGSRALW